VYPHTGGRNTLELSCPHCGGYLSSVRIFLFHFSFISESDFFCQSFSLTDSFFSSQVLLLIDVSDQFLRLHRVPAFYETNGHGAPFRHRRSEICFVLRFVPALRPSAHFVARCREKQRPRPLWEPGSASPLNFFFFVVLFFDPIFLTWFFLSPFSLQTLLVTSRTTNSMLDESVGPGHGLLANFLSSTSGWSAASRFRPP
jgi:hypothetical protein